MNESYHGSLDETLSHIGAGGQLELRSEYDMNPGVPKEAISRAVEFNDLEVLEGALAHEDSACVLAEPVMTNCDMVLPVPGYHDHLRRLCTRYGTYLWSSTKPTPFPTAAGLRHPWKIHCRGDTRRGSRFHQGGRRPHQCRLWP